MLCSVWLQKGDMREQEKKKPTQNIWDAHINRLISFIYIKYLRVSFNVADEIFRALFDVAWICITFSTRIQIPPILFS